MLKLILSAFFTVSLRRFQPLQIPNNNFVKMSYAFHNQDINSTYNDAALIPLEHLPKNDFYKNFTNNNYGKKYGGIVYPPK
jgi:hypothetical protein